jgi:glutaredoxin
MRKVLLTISLPLVPVYLALGVAPTAARDAKQTDLVLFYGRGCPHCAAMRDFLREARSKYPQLRVHEYEVYFNSSNANLFTRMAAAYNVAVEVVPTAFLGDEVISGYADDTCGRDSNRKSSNVLPKDVPRR